MARRVEAADGSHSRSTVSAIRPECFLTYSVGGHHAYPSDHCRSHDPIQDAVRRRTSVRPELRYLLDSAELHCQELSDIAVNHVLYYPINLFYQSIHRLMSHRKFTSIFRIWLSSTVYITYSSRTTYFNAELPTIQVILPYAKFTSIPLETKTEQAVAPPQSARIVST
jgi:hypothetical protein